MITLREKADGTLGGEHSDHRGATEIRPAPLRAATDGPGHSAVIAFADVVGYSTFMSQDERRTFHGWMTLFASLIRPEIERWSGRLAAMPGDAVVVEFGSVADALGWAHAVQRANRERCLAEALDDERSLLTLRIALHAGHVFVHEGNLFGDAVNLTARLHEHAGPGGIIISEAVATVLDQRALKDWRDLGRVVLKGFERPARIFRCEQHRILMAPPMRTEAGKPSLAVLPLQDRTGQPDAAYLAEGLVDDVTASLAGLSELFVIASASTEPFRGRSVDPREVGMALGVRYVVQGTLRRGSRGLQIAVELADAQTGGTLWGARMEFAPDQIFEAQEEIVRRIVAGLAPQVRGAELRRAMRKRPENLNAYDRFLRAVHVMGSTDRASFEGARGFLEEAMAEEPGFALPVAWAARWHSIRIGRGWSPDPDSDQRTALVLAERAVAIDRRNSLALATLGHLKSILLHDCEGALRCFEDALAASPNDSLAWTLSSGTLSYLDRGPDAVRHAEQGLRLSPQDPLRYAQWMFLAIAHYANRSFEQACYWIERSAIEHPTHRATMMVQAAALAGSGRLDEARQAAERYRTLSPNFSLDLYARTRQPFRTRELRDLYLSHLRSAGLPD